MKYRSPPRRIPWKVWAVIALTVTALPSGGRTETLHEWLAGADETNPEIRAALQRWESAKASALRSAGWADPMVGFDLERMTTRLSDVDGIEYMVQQDLPWFGKRKADLAAAQLQAEVVGFAYLETRRLVHSRITAAFWALWESRQRLSLARESLRVAEQTDSIAQARQAAGQAPQTDLLRARMETLRLSNEVVSVENRIGVALANLNALLNAPPSTPRATDAPPPLPAFEQSLEQLQESATMYCCTLVGAIRRKEAAAAMLRAARLEARPMTSARVEARQMDGGGIEEVDTGIFLTVPFVSRSKYKALLAATQAEVSMAEAELEAEIQETLAMVQRLYTEAEEHHRTVRLYETLLVPQARALVASSIEAYQAGTLSALELLDAQVMYQDAMLALQSETAAYASTHAELTAQSAPWTDEELATGLPPHEP